MHRVSDSDNGKRNYYAHSIIGVHITFFYTSSYIGGKVLVLLSLEVH